MEASETFFPSLSLSFFLYFDCSTCDNLPPVNSIHTHARAHENAVSSTPWNRIRVFCLGQKSWKRPDIRAHFRATVPLLHASVIYKGGGSQTRAKQTQKIRGRERGREKAKAWSAICELRMPDGLETWNKRGSVYGARCLAGQRKRERERESRGACAYVHTFVHLRIGRRFMGISGVLWVAGGRSVCAPVHEKRPRERPPLPARREREGSCSGAYTRGGWSDEDGELRGRSGQDRDRENA